MLVKLFILLALLYVVRTVMKAFIAPENKRRRFHQESEENPNVFDAEFSVKDDDEGQNSEEKE